MIRIVLLIIIFTNLLFRSPAANAQSLQQPTVSSDTIEISLLTCYPGPQVYELYGHEAIRVKTPDSDKVFNYGLFDFGSPNFIYRFVKGETDYFAGATTTNYFIWQYTARGSKIIEQTLNLTGAEKEFLLLQLEQDILPENRMYRYNYVKNNCATKILDRIESALASKSNATVNYTDGLPSCDTYREIMQHYNRNYPWYQFGIDLALGSGIDYPLSTREKMFVPMVMMNAVGDASVSDGRQLVKSLRILTEGNGDMTLPATPVLLSPIVTTWALFIITMLICLYAWRKKTHPTWLSAVWFGICGLAGCLIAFLVFVSEHEATSPNVLIWVLNPVCLIVPALIWIKRAKTILVIYMALNTSFIIGFLIGLIFGRQHINPAFIPVILTSALLSCHYFITIFRNNRYINIEIKH